MLEYLDGELSPNSSKIFKALELVAPILPVSTYWHDINGVVLGVNDHCLNQIGSSYKDIVGKSPYEFYPEHTAEHIVSHNTQVIRNGKVMAQEEWIEDITTGVKKCFLSTKAPLYGDDGTIIGVVGSFVDITGEKEAEAMKIIKHQRDLELLQSEAHKNKIMQEFGVIAAKVAHDISSPLMVANSAISKLEQNKEYLEEQICLIKQSLNDVKNISGKILTTYREITGSGNQIKLHKVDDGNIKRYLFLAPLLENQIGLKKIEWQKNPCTLELSISDNVSNTFIYISPTEFNRSLSNLLNNAYESLSRENKNIIVELSSSSGNQYKNKDSYKNDKIFILKIKDSGSGIPEDKIAKVLVGESTKHEGHGIGLSGAKSYFEANAGKLELTSVVNVGTEIKIELPLANDPIWFERCIQYNADTKLVVLDDSSTIIMLWQRILADVDLNCNYFMDIDSFMKWYDEQSNKENIILLTDYDLGDENSTGLDLVNNVKDIKSYLVTNHAEEFWLQDIVKQNNLKLLPKKMIEYIEFIKI